MVLIFFQATLKGKRIKFPSPYGDYGSYPQVELGQLLGMSQTFPSPYGDYGSYRRYGINVSYASMGGVSVPLRGLWFLSQQ